GRQGVQLSRRVSTRAGEVVALAYLGSVLSLVGRFTEAERCQIDAVRISRETGWRLYQPRCLTDLGYVERLEGDFASAREHLQQALILCREISGQSFAARAQVELSLVAHGQGHYYEALHTAEEALAVVGPIGEERQHHAGLMAVGRTQLSLGRLPAAAAAFRGALLVARTWRASGPVIEATAGLARVSLLEREISQAHAHVTALIDDVLAGPLVHLDDPAPGYLTPSATPPPLP